MDMAFSLLLTGHSYVNGLSHSGDACHNEEVLMHTIDRFVMAVTSEG
jgi:hypothetical protein